MKVLFVFVLMLLAHSGSSQSTFQMTYGGEQADTGLSVVATSDGGFVCLGHTMSFGAGALDMYLLKTDASGVELWNQPIGTENGEMGLSVQETNDGGLILCGGYNGPFNDSLVLIKTNSTGDILWNKRYSGSIDSDVGQAVIQTSDDGFIAVGFTGTDSSEDIFIVKTDINGNEEWTQVYQSTGRELASSIKQLSDDGFIMVGQTSTVGAGEEDIYLIRTDEFGDTLWTRTFGTASNEIGRSVDLTDDGGFIIVGYENTVGGDVLMIKTDEEGILEWSKEYESDSWDLAHSVRQLPNGEYIIGGRKGNTFDNANHMHCFKTDNVGEIIWETTLPMGTQSQANSMDLTLDGGIVLLGYSTVFVTDTQTDTDFYLAKITSDGIVGLNEPGRELLDISVFPNPFSSYIDIKVNDDAANLKVELVNVLGERLLLKDIHSKGIIRLERNGLVSGMYVLLIKQDGKIKASRTIIAQ